MSMSKPVCLFAFANDPRQSLRVDDEWRKAEGALERAHDLDQLEFHLVPSATMDDLYHKFNRFHNEIALFHFGGHSDDQALSLQNSMLGSSQLATLLGQEEHLKLAFLNGCANQGQIKVLFDKGVPAVIATTAPIIDAKARTLATQFYKALISGRNIQQAFEIAASYVNDESEGEMVQYRSLSVGDEEEEQGFPWGLYIHEEGVMDWRLTEKIVSDIPPSTSTKLSPERVQELKRYVERDQMKQLIGELKKEFQGNNLMDELLFQAGRYADLSRQSRLGIISAEQKELKKNQLTFAILNLIDKFQEEDA